MSLLVKSPSKTLPPGAYLVRIASIKTVENISDRSKQQLEITLEATDRSLDGASIRFWTSPILHSKGKLLPFIECVIGRSLSPAEFESGFDVDQLIGQELRILIRSELSPVGKILIKVTDFLPSQN